MGFKALICSTFKFPSSVFKICGLGFNKKNSSQKFVFDSDGSSPCQKKQQHAPLFYQQYFPAEFNQLSAILQFFSR